VEVAEALDTVALTVTPAPFVDLTSGPFGERLEAGLPGQTVTFRAGARVGQVVVVHHRERHAVGTHDQLAVARGLRCLRRRPIVPWNALTSRRGFVTAAHGAGVLVATAPHAGAHAAALASEAAHWLVETEQRTTTSHGYGRYAEQQPTMPLQSSPHELELH